VSYAALVGRQAFGPHQLRAPASADFPFASMNSVRSAGANRWLLASYVDAQNAFGATIRTQFRCLVEGSGPEINNYRIVDVTLDR
jgi:hypothetical protein